MNSRERVRRAIEFSGPDRIPVRYYDNPAHSDIVIAGFAHPVGWAPPEPNVDEWGCLWSTLNETIGQVKRHPLARLEQYHGYRFPDPHAPGRLEPARKAREDHPERYVAGSLGISGFNRMTFLTGFDELLAGLVLEPERIMELAEHVFGFESEIIVQFATLGLDAVWFWDDWGTQHGLMISPALWRRYFRPLYRRQFELIHAAGMHVVFHSCGDVHAIVEDLGEIGADMLHLNQPDLIGIDWLADRLGGRVCLHCPVDSQSTLVHGSDEDVEHEAQLLIEKLGCFNGGFVACGDEGWGHGSVSGERLAVMGRAFERYGARPPDARAWHRERELL